MRQRKRIPGRDREPKAVPTKWYRHAWPWMTATGVLVGWLLLNGITALSNLEQLPSATTKTLGHFLTWYYDDKAWSGVWSIAAEGYVDSVDLSPTDVRVEIAVSQGNVDGVIASPELCKAIPLFDFVLLEGRVHGNKVEAVAYDFIGGQRKNFFSLELERDPSDTSIMTVKPTNGISGFIPIAAKIRRHPDEVPMQTDKKAPAYCGTEREEFMKQFKSRPPSDGTR